MFLYTKISRCLTNYSNDSTMKKERHTYNPNGVSSRQIGLRLKPDEMIIIEQIAQKEQRTLSGTARLILIKGLEAIKQNSAATS